MIKAGSKIKVVSIDKEHQGMGKIYPNDFDMIGQTGTVTKRKNKNGFVDVDLDELGRNWVFLREDLEVIS